MDMSCRTCRFPALLSFHLGVFKIRPDLGTQFLHGTRNIPSIAGGLCILPGFEEETTRNGSEPDVRLVHDIRSTSSC